MTINSFKLNISEPKELLQPAPEERIIALERLLENGNMRAAEAFLAAGGLKIGDTAEDGTTALHLACRYGLEKEALALMEQGADFNRLDTDKHSPLSLALEYSLPFCKKIYAAAAQKDLIRLTSSMSWFYVNMEEADQKELNTVIPFEKIFDRKFEGHVWGFSGDFVVDGFLCRYESSMEEWMSPRFLQAWGEFINTLPPEHPHAHLKEKNEWTFLPLIDEGPSENHISYLCAGEKRIYLCDRGGDGPFSGVVAYEANEEQQELLRELMSKDGASDMEVVGYIQKEMKERRLISLPQQGQKVGNCGLASLKSAFYAVLFDSLADQGLSPPRAASLARKTYKEFTAWLRERALKGHLKSKEPDQNFLFDILERLEDPARMKGIFTRAQDRNLLIQIIKAQLNLKD